MPLSSAMIGSAKRAWHAPGSIEELSVPGSARDLAAIALAEHTVCVRDTWLHDHRSGLQERWEYTVQARGQGCGA